ncbi:MULTISPECIES: hypothetical protein [unclassified Lactococcus]|uniref:hypothetical protein n=1 Tax=unclassified Lactococcus TaxID=2643510 RepID=UPI0011CBC688|nr:MULTISPECIES: hypothetical protein [unclassified Lactococcus]MQW23958.1 hypothetical protein [Lactococcus sp. dk101]TXK36979.1 hypothetical protein FVP42_10210 [Lactococcus sp. dk310]TXK47604.1 hypothetical protein FVP43_09915 [Lactococcus sp. dk322]
MTDILIILIIVAVICFQTFAGYKNKKILGSVLPLVYIGLVIFFLFKGLLTWSIRDVTFSILGPLLLMSIYSGGKEAHNKKQKKEIEKMKAKDISNKLK